MGHADDRRDADGSYASQPGDKDVLVGIIDTGIDGSHPDIAAELHARPQPQLRRPTSRRSTDRASTPAAWTRRTSDDDGHGTHVAGTIASPINGLGIAGVAPEVTLVNIRAGQDSGYFFLQPTLDALTYAGDTGIDVVNMSFYVDPWLYNCTDNPADSPAEQAEQRRVRRHAARASTTPATRASRWSSALGNGATDLGGPPSTGPAPTTRPAASATAAVDNGCITVPAETRGVISVSAGPSKRKAYYSDYGLEQADVSAPGGDVYDTPDGTRPQRPGSWPPPRRRSPSRTATSTETACRPTSSSSATAAAADLRLLPVPAGTSMASPHAAGVAALVVSRFGKPTRRTAAA